MPSIDIPALETVGALYPYPYLTFRSPKPSELKMNFGPIFADLEVLLPSKNKNHGQNYAPVPPI